MQGKRRCSDHGCGASQRATTALRVASLCAFPPVNIFLPSNIRTSKITVTSRRIFKKERREDYKEQLDDSQNLPWV